MTTRAPTYRDRVQRVLSEVAKSTNDGIIYDVLVDKVHFSIFHDDLRYGPRSRDFIRDAVGAEVRARRALLIHEEAEWKVSLTSDGKRFYQALGGSVILEADDKRLARLTVTQLHEQAELIRRVVREIKHLFVHYDPHGTDADNLDLPGAVGQLFRRIDGLNQDWTNFQAELAATKTAMRHARAGRGLAVRPSSPPVSDNGGPSRII